MRLTLVTFWCDLDVTLFERRDDTDQPSAPMVAGGMADTWPAPTTADATQQVPEDHRRGTGFTA